MAWFNAIVRTVTKAVATAANAGAKAIAKVCTAVKNTAKMAVAKVATVATKLKDDFHAFIAKASCVLKKTWRRVRFTLRVKIRRVVSWIKKNPWKTAFIVIGFILAVALPPIILHAIGFTGPGIAAGSLAAAIQSSIGPVSAGGLFAILTSAMMGGYGVPIVVGMILAFYALVVTGLSMSNGKGNKED